jgi:hypothetical protein
LNQRTFEKEEKQNQKKTIILMLPTEMFVCEQNHDVKQKQKDQHAFSQFGFLFGWCWVGGKNEVVVKEKLNRKISSSARTNNFLLLCVCVCV